MESDQDVDPETEELRATQLAREAAERRLAAQAPVEEETAQHQRRADKARYLREKLEERAETEREGGDEDEGEGRAQAEREGEGGDD